MFMAPEHLRARWPRNLATGILSKFPSRTTGRGSLRAKVRLRTGHRPARLTVLNQEVTGTATGQTRRPKGPKNGSISLSTVAHITPFHKCNASRQM
jgi:hypothetical protein